MKLEQLILILGAILGIAGFFFPYLHLDTSAIGLSMGEISMSGYSYVRCFLDNFGLLEFDGDYRWLRWSAELWNEASEPIGLGKAIALTFVQSLPIMMLLYSIGHLFRGLTGKQYKRGIMFNLLFMGLAWGTFYFISMDGNYLFLGEKVDQTLNFFKIAGLGYWMSFGGIFLAGLSLFFEKKSS